MSRCSTVLSQEHDHLHDAADPDAEHQHEQRRLERARADVQLGQQHYADNHRADDVRRHEEFQSSKNSPAEPPTVGRVDRRSG